MDWIDIKVRKPENGKDVLVSCGKMVIIAAYWGKYELETSCDIENSVEYDEKTDEYYAPEGWYECVQHSSNVNYTRITDIKITHWMSMPDPYDESN